MPLPCDFWGCAGPRPFGRLCSVCGRGRARRIGGKCSGAYVVLGLVEPTIVGLNQPREPQPRRVSRHDTPLGPFFSLRAALRVRLSLRLVAPKGAVRWWASVPSRSKSRWGGGLTPRADVDVGEMEGGFCCAPEQAAGARRRTGYVAALRRRCDGRTRVFAAARATLTHKISILAHCGQLAFQRPGQRTKRNTKCVSPRC